MTYLSTTWQQAHDSGKNWFQSVPVSMILLMILLTGCATPIGTRSVGIRQTYDQINVNAIKKDIYSDATRSVLHRFYLEEQYKKDPAATIVTLHGMACEDDRRDLLYALAELTYLTGRHYTSGDTDGALGPENYFLASAVYAYLYLLGDPEGDPPDPYDRRVRTASDFYNTALAQSLLHRNHRIVSRSRRVRLPVGTLLLELDQSRFLYDLETLETLIPADTLSVRGLSVRDRKPGLGAPFIAVKKKVPDSPVVRSFPGTLFLRVEGDIQDLEKGGRAQVELFSSYDVRETDVHGKTIPLENDLSAQLAYSLNQPYFWDLGKRMFFKGPVMQPGLFSIQSYSPEKIPVVFVHGTFSSPVRWAEMFNTLRADPVLWEKYQFWFYLYDSSKQLVQSALDFRNALSEMENALDPGGTYPAMEKMVIVGHSQGGLLAKLTATETGDNLIRALIQKEPDELDIHPKELAMVQKFLVYSPLPFVSRIIFISTPHRGSYLSIGWIRQLVQRLVSLPRQAMETSTQFIALAQAENISGFKKKKIITSLDGMSPDNPSLLALADIPLAPDISGHSIISIKGNDTPPDGEDGVVKYTSAHIDYVQSEFIVRSGHSCQAHPLVIEEVRRILLEHLESQNLLSE